MQSFKQLDMLFRQNNMNKFWNLVRKSKKPSNTSTEDISIQTLSSYYSESFSLNNYRSSDTIRNATLEVRKKHEQLQLHCDKTFIFPRSKLIKYINKLRSGCAAGMDGITAEHLKYASTSNILEVLQNMLSSL